MMDAADAGDAATLIDLELSIGHDPHINGAEFRQLLGASHGLWHVMLCRAEVE